MFGGSYFSSRYYGGSYFGLKFLGDIKKQIVTFTMYIAKKVGFDIEL